MNNQNDTRQISNTWDGQEDTPKLKQVMSQIMRGPKPALVYSNWIGNGLRPLGSMLGKNNVNYLEFTGGMTDRQKIEKSYYDLCSICNRNSYQISLEGCDCNN